MLGEIICVIHESWLAFFLSLLPFLLLFFGGGEGGVYGFGISSFVSLSESCVYSNMGIGVWVWGLGGLCPFGLFLRIIGFLPC